MLGIDKDMDLRADLKTLLSFSLELQDTSLDHLISCATNLLLFCPSARPSVLSVYGRLLADLTLVYVQQESASSDTKSASVSFGKWIPLFKTRTQTRKTLHSVSVIKRLSSNCSSDEKETPSSPPASAADEKEDMMMVTDGDEDEDREDTVKTVMDRLSVSLLDLTRKESSLEQEITFWAIERLTFISGIISPEAGQDMKEMIAYLTQCPVTCLLMQILNNSLSLKRLDLKDILLKLRGETDVSHDRIEWIVCCLMSAFVSSGHDISSCMQLLLESSSMPDSLVCSVLSFLSSSLNPALIRSLIQAAISNSSQRNSLSFLLRICCKSKALLDVFCKEVTDRKLSLESLSFLDSLSSSKQLDSEAKKHLVECLLLADKSFSLLLLVMDVSVDTRASVRLRREALSVLQALVLETQDLSYSRSRRNDQRLMQDLKQNYKQLVSHPLFKARKLQEIMRRLVVSLCVYHGFPFSVQVVHCLLNQVQGNDSTDFTVHPSLISLLSSLSLFYGAEMKQLPNRLLCLQETKTNEFWNNFYALSVMNEGHGVGNRCRFHVAWELESITEHLVRHLHLEMKLNTRTNLDSVLIILRMILYCLNQRETQRLEYSLCVSLVIHYIRLTERLEEVLDRNSEGQETDRDKKYTEQLMTALSTNEEIMRSLTSCNQSQCHQQILCKTFLDCLLWHPQEARGLEDHLSLTQQNDNDSKTGQRHCLKLRKALMRDEESNVCNKKRNHRLLSRQLIVSAVSSCIQDMSLFSKVLLEAVTPASSSFPLIGKDVLQSIWPEQDFVKVTIERDLLISKEFERNPVLWDLVHVMVSEAQSLNDSLLLFQALMAVQLTEWTKCGAIQSLDTLSPQNSCLEATQRLLALLFQSRFMPLQLQAITSVLPSFSSFEVFCVLNDIWSFIHDQNQLRNSNKISPYLHRLRVILSNRDPGPFFVNIFKPILIPILS